MSEIDLTRGIYRRIYAGFRMGKRICAVSIGAEAWFWRLNAIADDYGNFAADPTLLKNEAGGRRQVTTSQSEGWLAELVPALVTLYTVAGERFGHIVGFEKIQPAGKNGRRIRRFPMHPGESGGIQGDPGVLVQSGPAHSHPESHPDTQMPSHSEGGESKESSAPIRVGGVGETQDTDWTPDKLRRFLILMQVNPTTADELSGYAHKFVGVNLKGEFARIRADRSRRDKSASLVGWMDKVAGIDRNSAGGIAAGIMNGSARAAQKGQG